MPELFVYLLKVNIALVLFYLVFHFLLRRLTFYTLNRFYLLFAFLFSALFPLFDLKDWVTSEQQVVPDGVQYIVLDWESIQQTGFNVWPYLEWLFWGIVAFFVMRMLFRLFSLWQIHRESVPATWHFFSYRHVLRRIDPFSFWKNIYVHVEAHQDGELHDIFSHEQIHVEQLHTLDTLMAELFTVVSWFNPAAWLMRTAVRENLEFITDRRVIQSGVDRRAYQYSLLKIGGVTTETSDTLGNHFNFKHLKTRIMMMNKRRSANAHLSKYVFAVPLVVMLALVVTLSKAYDKPAMAKVEAWVNTLGDQDQPKEDNIKLSKTMIEGDPAVKLKPASKDSVINIRIVGDSTIRLRGKDFLLTTKSNPLIIVDGVPFLNSKLHEFSPDDIESVSVLKGEGGISLYGPRAKDGVILIQTKKGSISDRTTAIAGRKEYEVVEGRAIQADSARVTRIRIEGKDMPDDHRVKQVIVRGYPIAVQDSTIRQGTTSVRTVEGRVFFKTDSVSLTLRQAGTTMSLLDSVKFQAVTPYVLIDGKEGDLSAVSPQNIETITVLKGDAEALKKYGSRALHGVILVSTKK